MFERAHFALSFRSLFGEYEVHVKPGYSEASLCISGSKCIHVSKHFSQTSEKVVFGALPDKLKIILLFPL
jgi:hypothetical protein